MLMFLIRDIPYISSEYITNHKQYFHFENLTLAAISKAYTLQPLHYFVQFSKLTNLIGLIFNS